MGIVQAKEISRSRYEGDKKTASASTAARNDGSKVMGHLDKHQVGDAGSVEISLDSVKARVDKINIDGLSRTKDDVVMDSVKPLFSASDVQQVIIGAHQVRKRLENLGCFNSIGVLIDTSSGSDATPEGLEVTFQVSEMKRLTGAINTLVGSNEGSLVVSVMLPNLIGRGERLQTEYSYGNRRTCNCNVGFVKPLRGRSNALFTSSAFQHVVEQPWSGYKQIDRGLLFDLAFTSAPLVRHNLQWETAWRELSVLNRAVAFEIREMSGPSLKGSLRHILSVDRRDEIIFPHKGTLLQLTTEYAGIGGNVNFFKNEAQFQANIPLSPDLVFQASLQGGLLKARGSKPTSVCDNFFLGGPLSLRGFETRGVGPQAGRNAIGASTYWAGALHLYTPLPFKPGVGGFGELFRTHLFINAGNIGNFEFSDDCYHNFKVLAQNMRVAYGVGVAMRLGDVARIELNYCVPHAFERNDLVNRGIQFGLGVHFL